jgi:alpha-beta hydrolase superfamily lysophospholipase
MHKGTVLMFHGHGSNKSAVIREAEEFYSLGYNVITTDFRAHGNSEGTICTIGYNESKDVKAVYDYIQQKGETNIVLWGISLGASTITKAIYDYNLQPSKIILEMPFGSLNNAVKAELEQWVYQNNPLAHCFVFGVVPNKVFGHLTTILMSMHKKLLVLLYYNGVLMTQELLQLKQRNYLII